MVVFTPPPNGGTRVHSKLWTNDPLGFALSNGTGLRESLAVVLRETKAHLPNFDLLTFQLPLVRSMPSHGNR